MEHRPVLPTLLPSGQVSPPLSSALTVSLPLPPFPRPDRRPSLCICRFCLRDAASQIPPASPPLRPVAEASRARLHLRTLQKPPRCPRAPLHTSARPSKRLPLQRQIARLRLALRSSILSANRTFTCGPSSSLTVSPHRAHPDDSWSLNAQSFCPSVPLLWLALFLVPFCPVRPILACQNAACLPVPFQALPLLQSHF